MAKVDVSAKLKDVEGQAPNPVVTVQYDFGASMSETIALFGEQVVFNKAVDSLVIDCQALVRRAIRKGKTQAEIQALVDAWKPSAASTVRKSATEKVGDLVGKMSAEEKAALLKSLKESLKG